MKQYDNSMKISQIKADMRITIMNEIEEFLKSKYEVVGLVGSNKIGVAMGTYQDGKFINDTCCVVQVSAKPFYEKDSIIKDDGKEGRAIQIYDLRGQIDNFKNGVEE